MQTDDDKREERQRELDRAQKASRDALERRAAAYRTELAHLAEFLKRRNDFQNRLNNANKPES